MTMCMCNILIFRVSNNLQEAYEEYSKVYLGWQNLSEASVWLKSERQWWYYVRLEKLRLLKLDVVFNTINANGGEWAKRILEFHKSS